MTLSDTFESIADKPWLILAAVVGAVWMFRPSSGGGGGVDYSATLTSQKIASETNVALAQTAANVAVAYSARDTAMAEFNKDVTLGAMSYALQDRQSSIMRDLSFMQTAQALAENTSGLIANMFSESLGHREAIVGLNNQMEAIHRAALNQDMQIGLGLTQIAADKEVAMHEISVGRAMNLDEINLIMSQDDKFYGNLAGLKDYQVSILKARGEIEKAIAETQAYVSLGQAALASTTALAINAQNQPKVITPGAPGGGGDGGGGVGGLLSGGLKLIKGLF